MKRRPLWCGRLARRMLLCIGNFLIVPETRPSAPAFWAAVTLWRPGDPASHGQRGHSVGIGRTVTTLPARRRPASRLGEMLTALSPWSARCDNVREATRCRRASGAHCQTPHSRWALFFRVLEGRRSRARCVGWAWAHLQTPSGRGDATTPVREPPIRAYPTLNCDVLAPFAMQPCDGPRPSGSPMAPQRRANSVVEVQNGEDCDHAAHANGGLLANGKRCSRCLRRGLPGMDIVRGGRRCREV